MILVVGAKGAGKKEYVRSLGYTDDEITTCLLSDAPVFYALEETLRTDCDTDELFDILLKKEVVVCCEVGCGIVPLEKSEREYRDRVGEFLMRLAKEAKIVVRIIVGIPQVIKGEPPCR